MIRAVLWAHLALLVLGAALLGLRYGYLYATTTETEVINFYAYRYVQDRGHDDTGTGATLTDCVAFPAPPEERRIWLIVSCGPTPYDASTHFEYYVDRLGRLVTFDGPATRALTSHGL